MSIIVTGAAGFIGSSMIAYINMNFPEKNIIAVDDFSVEKKKPNLENKRINEFINRDDFINRKSKIDFNDIEVIIHLGARTDTTEQSKEIFGRLNLYYSMFIWEIATSNDIPLIYASSAATYGDGKLGYDDDHELVEKLKPLNPYGESKNEFDKWVLKQEHKPSYWNGLKFFNVYGPNEYHKGRMASVIFHAFNQIKSNGKVKLFRSHNPKFRDGKQIRDFIYVMDLFKVIDFFLANKDSAQNGIYNLGTGNARTFIDLVNAVFNALDIAPVVEYIDTPPDIREKYQYFTEANMSKLRSLGFSDEFYSLEAGIKEYVKDYLINNVYF